MNALADGVDVMALLSLGFNTLEIRTAYSPPVTIDLTGPPDPETEARLRDIQPAIIFTGRAGRMQIAPYGIPSGISLQRWGVGLGVGFGAALLGTLLLGSAVFGGRR